MRTDTFLLVIDFNDASSDSYINSMLIICKKLHHLFGGLLHYHVINP